MYISKHILNFIIILFHQSIQEELRRASKKYNLHEKKPVQGKHVCCINLLMYIIY
jgi:hypothetical protein